MSGTNALLYPNPADKFFTLVLKSAEKSSGTLRIHDISGREVAVREVGLQAGDNILNQSTSHLQSGIYFVELKAGDLTISKKLIIAN
jgi:hypothetical protein